MKYKKRGFVVNLVVLRGLNSSVRMRGSMKY